MSVSKSVKALLNISGVKQRELVPVLGVANAQSLSNKFREERWTAADLVKVADFTGCKVAFVFPNGERIVLENSADDSTGADPAQAAPHGGMV